MKATGRKTNSMAMDVKSGLTELPLKETTLMGGSKVKAHLHGQMAVLTMATSLKTTFMARVSTSGQMAAYTKALG